MKPKNTLLALLMIVPLLINAQIQIGNDIDGEAVGDGFGKTVSLSLDGSVIAIGAPENDGTNGTNSGHVRVYQNTGGTWTQIGSDIDGEAGSDSFGFAISLSSDGSILAVGAYKNDGNGMDSGHVRVFQNTGGTWTQVGLDINGEAAFDRFGYSVSLSSDGTILAVGAPFNNGAAGSNTGHVRVYQNTGGTWTQIGSDIDGEAIDDQSGFSLDISANGTIVAIGAPNNNGTTTNTNVGHVRVYENISGVWTQIGSDIDGIVSDNSFGTSISLSADGTIFASGMPFSDGIGSNSGVTRVYENISNTWTQIGSDISGEVAQDESGHKDAISLSSNGNIIAIGSRFNDGVNGAVSGNVRVFKNISNTWTHIGSDIDGEASNDQSGYSANISSDGSVIAIGAPFNSNATGGGQARVYDLSNILSIVDFASNERTSVFPNPTNSIFNIEANTNIESIIVFNMLGEEVAHQQGNGTQNLSIDISRYQSGTYFIKVQTANFEKVIKMIKR